MYFAVSGVETDIFSPLSISFIIALLGSTCGISGAFLLLPYQISILGYSSPGVSATNHIYNIIACPGGVWRYYHEGRLLFPLVVFIAIGTLPGVFVGALIRISFLSNPVYFKLFAAAVLLYLAIRLILNIKRQSIDKKNIKTSQSKCEIIFFSPRGFKFSHNSIIYSVSSIPIIGISMLVGLIGGIYGVGGGAIMTPFLVSIFGLPIHAVAGASLFATFLTSIAGVSFFALLASITKESFIAPDWALGTLLGLGGLFGMYCGASVQKFISPLILRIFLSAIIVSLSGYYFYQSLCLLM